MKTQEAFVYKSDYTQIYTPQIIASNYSLFIHERLLNLYLFETNINVKKK